MDVLKQYGIKEVADVTIYKIEKNGAETPFLFLDSLKVSTVEQTAEQADARGGKGNPKLVTWDYGKEINLTLEDALYSPKSMALMWGGKQGDWVDTTATISKMLTAAYPNATATQIIDDCGNTWNIDGYLDPNNKGEYVSGTSGLTANKYYTFHVTAAVKKSTLTIDADDFPGTYKIVGDTYARDRDTGEDEYFQFIVHRAKLSAEETLTLEAEGDPTTFNLNATVLRPKDGKMMELVQYNF